ncbi:MAG: hypothetical protein ACOCYV_02225 [Planctomycetota bacterium]
MRRVIIGLLVLLSAPLPAAQTDTVVRERLRELDPAWYDAERDSWNRVRPPVSRPDGETRDTGGGSGRAGLLTWFIIALVMGLVIAVAALAILAWREDPRREPDPDPGGPGRPGRAPLVVPHFLDLDLDAASRADVLAALETAMEASDWRKAVVCCFAAQLLVLSEAGLLRLERGTTNRRFLAQVRSSLANDPQRESDCGDRFAASITIFEQVYFGHAPARREQVLVLRDHLLALRAPSLGPHR